MVGGSSQSSGQTLQGLKFKAICSEIPMFGFGVMLVNMIHQDN